MDASAESVARVATGGTEALSSEVTAALRELRRQVAEVLNHGQRLLALNPKHHALRESVMHLQKAQLCLRGGDDEEEPWVDGSVKVDWARLAKQLKRKRMQANLGQKELAELIDISEAMVRAIESGQRRPSREVLLRLLASPPLGLRLEDITADPTGDSIIPTSWLAPHYDPAQLITSMVEQLNSSGGALEQTTAYLDYQSAKDFLDICESPSYAKAFSNTIPLEHLAQRIVSSAGAGGLDVIALGCGDAKRESKLVESLIQHGRRHGITDVRLFLLDISHLLLTVGHNNARDILGKSVTSIVALHGNFHDLPKYPLYSERDVRTRTRVFTMLGCTLANLDNEVRFFRDTMASAAPGDFFVLDFTNAYAPADSPELIREQDPNLRAGIHAGSRTLLAGPLYRYVKGVTDVELSLEINTDGLIRGCYEVAYVAHVSTQGSPQKRRFAVFRNRRYECEPLIECLSRCGWQTLERVPYGASDRCDITLALLRKR